MINDHLDIAQIRPARIQIARRELKPPAVRVVVHLTPAVGKSRHAIETLVRKTRPPAFLAVHIELAEPPRAGLHFRQCHRPYPILESFEAGDLSASAYYGLFILISTVRDGLILRSGIFRRKHDPFGERVHASSQVHGDRFVEAAGLFEGTYRIAGSLDSSKCTVGRRSVGGITTARRNVERRIPSGLMDQTENQANRNKKYPSKSPFHGSTHRLFLPKNPFPLRRIKSPSIYRGSERGSGPGRRPARAPGCHRLNLQRSSRT